MLLICGLASCIRDADAIRITHTDVCPYMEIFRCLCIMLYSSIMLILYFPYDVICPCLCMCWLSFPRCIRAFIVPHQASVGSTRFKLHHLVIFMRLCTRCPCGHPCADHCLWLGKTDVKALKNILTTYGILNQTSCSLTDSQEKDITNTAPVNTTHHRLGCLVD